MTNTLSADTAARFAVVEADVSGVYASTHADLMRTFAEATTLDLAVAPMVVAVDAPGIGASAKLHAMASACNMAHLEYRLDMMDVLDFNRGLPVLHNGEIVQQVVIPSGLLSLVTGPAHAVVILDFENDRAEVLETMLGLIKEHATVATIVVLRTVTRTDETTGRSPVDAAHAAITKVLGIHRALVPACTMAISHRAIQAARRVRLVGALQLNSSRRGERYCEITMSEPYDHEARITVRATGDQDDDALNAALEAAWDASSVALIATIEDGDMVCTTADIEVLETRA